MWLEKQNSTLPYMLFYLNSTGSYSQYHFCVCVIQECPKEIDYTTMKCSYNKWKEITFRSEVFELHYVCRNTPFLKLITIAPFIECSFYVASTVLYASQTLFPFNLPQSSTRWVLLSYFPFLNLFLNFIYYFWLHWVFVAVRGLSLVVASGGYASLGCTGFSLQWLFLLWSTGSRCTGFSSCGTWAQWLWLAGSRAQA